MAKSRNRSRVLEQELLNFNSFQDSQLNILNSISSSLESNLEANLRVKDSLTSISESMRSMLNTNRSLELESLRFQRQSHREQRSLHNERIGALREEISASSAFSSALLNLSKNVANTANRFSYISNTLMQTTGYAKSDVQSARSAIVHDVIGQLNKDTGYFYNPEESYKKIVEIANSSDVGSLEAIQEITRPVLLASESMNVNTSELAKLLGKWYSRYNFTSSEMEAMVDDIRGNTAGNNATAEATLQNISKFQDFIGAYADSNDEMKAMVEAISTESSRLGAAGIDSGYVFDLLYQIGSGDMSNMPGIMSLLANSGSGLSFQSAQSMLRSGDTEEFMAVSEALIDGMVSIGNKLKNSTMSAEAIRAFGLDYNNILNTMSAKNGLMSTDEFLDSVSGAQTTSEAVRGMYNTHANKVENFLNGFAEAFARIQETFDIGFTDIIILLTSIRTLQAVGGAGGIPGFGGMRGAIGRVGGAIGKYALPVAGVAAGIGLGLDGLYNMQNSDDLTSKILSGGELAGGTIGAIGMTAGALGIGGTLAAAGPFGLLVGAASFAGRKLWEEYTELSGNTEKVAKEIDAIETSLEQENRDRIKNLADLNYQFNQLSDITEQRELLERSGLFSKEELDKTADDQLQSLINRYKEAAKAMGDITDEIVKTTEKYYTGKTDAEQKDFISKLSGVSNQEDRQAIIDLMYNDLSADMQNKIDKFNKDEDISNKEWKSIIGDGFWNSIGSKNLKDSQISTELMNLVAGGQLGYDVNYTGSKYLNDIESAYASLQEAASYKNKESYHSILSSINEAEWSNEFYDAYNKDSIDALTNTVDSYDVGTDYIQSNRLAVVHEGESVVPKRYNPNANLNELQMLRDYYKKSTDRGDSEMSDTMREFVSAVREIKEFLVYWRDDNIKREDIRDRMNKYDYTRYQLANYRTN